MNDLRSQVYSPDTITNMGITLHDKKGIVVKSSEHSRADFSSISDKILRVSTPGVGNMNIHEIPYQNLNRCIWPLA